MKRVLVIGLIAAMLVSSMAKTFVLADYILNYDFISTVLCINKDKPEMHCNGKCHLAKELKKQEEEPGTTTPKSGIVLQEISGVITPSQQLPFSAIGEFEFLFPPVTIIRWEFVSTCFHPPDSRVS